MKTKDFFKEGKNNIGYIGDNFKENFMDMEFSLPESFNFKTNILKRNMLDSEILEEFKLQESNLGELAYIIKNDLLKDKFNIFYMRDSKNILWPVNFGWYSDVQCWYVNAYSVKNPYSWSAGNRVLSRDCNFETKTLDPLSFCECERCPVCKKIIKQ